MQTSLALHEVQGFDTTVYTQQINHFILGNYVKRLNRVCSRCVYTDIDFIIKLLLISSNVNGTKITWYSKNLIHIGIQQEIKYEREVVEIETPNP